MAHVVVIGGGFAGQLVQLALPSARLLDWRRTAPANHLETRIGPQYLWEPIPGVPSTSFPVTTLVDGMTPSEAGILAYKKKIGKELDGGNWGLQFQHRMTGWASALPVPRVEYDSHVEMVDLSGHSLCMKDGRFIHYDVLVSTIPLDAFLKLCVIAPIVQDPWKQDSIYMRIRETDSRTEGMVLNYISDPGSLLYRITFSQGMEFAESIHPIAAARKLPVGKIHSHPQSADVLQKLAVHDCYCFGRFATWRPDELAHETWQHIERWRIEVMR